MSGRTQLYQQPRSPLIQGRSKRERPLWQPWLGGWLAGWAVAGGAVIGLIGWPDPSTSFLYVAGVLGVASMLGSAAGAAAGKAWGLRRRWISALAGALLLASLVALFVSSGLTAA